MVCGTSMLLKFLVLSILLLPVAVAVALTLVVAVGLVVIGLPSRVSPLAGARRLKRLWVCLLALSL